MSFKNGEKRFARWKIKYDIVRNGKPIRQLTPEAEQKLKKEYIIMATIENEIKKILGQSTAPTMLNFSYLAYAREVYGLTRRYKNKKLQDEIEFATWKWKTRMLNEELLRQIKDKVLAMMNINLTV